MDALLARLDTPAGFLSLMRGMFADNSGRKAHAIWTSAGQKAVHETVELRFATHDSHGYAVLAFSTDGPIDAETREALAAQAKSFPLATLRYQAVMYSALLPLGWHPRSNEPNDHTITRIAEPYADIRVFVAVTGPRAADRPLVAHCVLDGREFIYPIPADRLADLGFTP